MTGLTVDLDLPPDTTVDEEERGGMLATAVFDAAREYRYLLTRVWDTSLPTMTWVMLNPSVADALVDDPTIRRLTHRTNGFARRPALGVGGVRVVNLFALRATDPKELRAHDDPVGPLNDVFIRQSVSGAKHVVCAWGADGHLRDRSAAVGRRLARVAVQPQCLGVTRGGEPRHPLYLRGDLPFVAYTPAGVVACR